MNSRNNINPVVTIIIMLASIVMIIAGIIVFVPYCASSSSNEAVRKGIQYIEELEQKDVAEVDAELKKKTASEDTAGMDVWEKLNFYDTYIMGDSRCEPFLWSGLKTEHVFAEKSTTIKYIGEHIDDIANARPGNLVLSYGMNDMGMYAYDPDNYWENGDDYVVEFDEYIDMIHEVSPDTNVYINSIIPVLSQAIELQPRWAAIDEWNQALKKYCSENDVGYIDTTYITYDYGEFFDDDGVHFYNQDILDAWGESILNAIEDTVYR